MHFKKKKIFSANTAQASQLPEGQFSLTWGLMGSCSLLSSQVQPWTPNGSKWEESRRFPLVPVTREGTMNTNWRFPLNIREHIFYVRFTQHWHRAVQASCGVFLLGGVRKPLVCGLGQLVDGSAWAGGFDQVTSRGLPTAVILWFPRAISAQRGLWMSQSGLQLVILHLLCGMPLVMAAKTMAWECSGTMHGQVSWAWLYWQLNSQNRIDHTLLFLIFRGLHLHLTLLQVSHVQDKVHESCRVTAYQCLLAIPCDSM